MIFFSGTDSDKLTFLFSKVYKTPEGANLSAVYLTDINWSKEGNLSLVSGAYAKLGVWHDLVKARPAIAYLVHEDCWTVLAQQFLGESQIDLGRVFDICKDIPSALRNAEKQLGKSPLFIAFACVDVHT